MDLKSFKNLPSSNNIFFEEELNFKKKVIFNRLQRDISKEEVLEDKDKISLTAASLPWKLVKMPSFNVLTDMFNVATCCWRLSTVNNTRSFACRTIAIWLSVKLVREKIWMDCICVISSYKISLSLISSALKPM